MKLRAGQDIAKIRQSHPMRFAADQPRISETDADCLDERPADDERHDGKQWEQQKPAANARPSDAHRSLSVLLRLQPARRLRRRLQRLFGTLTLLQRRL